MDGIDILMTLGALFIAFAFAGGLVLDYFDWEDE